MKFLFTPFLFLPLFVFGQENNPAPELKTSFSHEIGINLFSVTNLVFPTAYDAGSCQVHPVSGLYYKYHFGQNALRASIDYRQKVTFDERGGGYELSYLKTANIRRTGELHLGYEREFGHGRLQGFAFSELLFGLANEQGIRTWYSCFGGGVDEPYSVNSYSGGMAAGGGLRYQAGTHLSVTLEAGANGSYSLNKDQLHPEYLTYGRWNYNLLPVGRLGLAYGF